LGTRTKWSTVPVQLPPGSGTRTMVILGRILAVRGTYTTGIRQFWSYSYIGLVSSVQYIKQTLQFCKSLNISLIKVLTNITLFYIIGVRSNNLFTSRLEVYNGKHFLPNPILIPTMFI
jgi:hypothetical protein